MEVPSISQGVKRAEAHNPIAARALLRISGLVAEKRIRVPRNPAYAPGNYDYLKADIESAKRAAAWEGITITDYFRSALKTRLRETQAKRAEMERRIKGENA